MRKSLVALVLAFLLIGVASSVFAGTFIGVGGDADLFPENGGIISGFVLPLLRFEDVSLATGYGIEGVFGWKDLAFRVRYGKLGDSILGGWGIKKKLFNENSEPFSCVLLLDGDSIFKKDVSDNGLYLGAVISKRVENKYPYVGLLFTNFYTQTDPRVGPFSDKSINGVGLAFGMRYDFDAHWSSIVEFDHNFLSPSTAVSWPRSISSVIAFVSYRR
jgi:hypothetical protein